MTKSLKDELLYYNHLKEIGNIEGGIEVLTAIIEGLMAAQKEDGVDAFHIDDLLEILTNMRTNALYDLKEIREDAVRIFN